MNENLFNRLFWDAFAIPSESQYPPYNIIQEGNDFKLEFAVAGFALEELDVEYNGSSLIVSSKKPKEGEVKPVYVHKGLSTRNFRQTIAVRGQFEIGDVYLTNGILTITMKDKTERIKPKIQIRDGLKEYIQPKLEERKYNTGD